MKMHMMDYFGNYGITVNLTELPEHKKYAEYYLNHSPFRQFLLRTFNRAKVKELHFNCQCAFLNEVIKKGQEQIEPKPKETPLATLDWMEHNGRHPE